MSLTFDIYLCRNFTLFMCVYLYLYMHLFVEGVAVLLCKYYSINPINVEDNFT